MKTNHIVAILLGSVALGALTLSIPVYATPSLSVSGISGDTDLKDRSPLLTYTKDVTSTQSKISASATVVNDGYKKYPIRYDFYINGELFSSQVTSTELPLTPTITLDRTDHPLPYNYTIVATLITPNRTISTTSYGSVVESEVGIPRACTLTSTDSSLPSPSYTASSVSFSGDSTKLNTTFTGVASDGNGDKDFTVTLTISNGTTATGTISISALKTDASVSGTVTFTDGVLSAVQVNNTDSTITLDCGTASN